MQYNIEDIVHVIKERGLTGYKIAEDTGLSEVGVNKIINGKSKNPRSSTLEIIHNYLHNNSTKHQNKYYPDVYSSVGLEIKIENDELNSFPVDIPGWEKGIKFINVYGDSMYPKYCSGEIIGIKEVEPQYINFGYAYVVTFNDGQVFLKYIRKGKDEEHWLLASENPKYEDREYHLSLIRKVYIVKGVITKTTI